MISKSFPVLSLKNTNDFTISKNEKWLTQKKMTETEVDIEGYQKN